MPSILPSGTPTQDAEVKPQVCPVCGAIVTDRQETATLAASVAHYICPKGHLFSVWWALP